MENVCDRNRTQRQRKPPLTMEQKVLYVGLAGGFGVLRGLRA
jgi:hypothetical protein